MHLNVSEERVAISGKLFCLGRRKWYLKGLVYGPFAPGRGSDCLPERGRLLADLAHMRELGANCVRVFHPPSIWFLDDALESGLRVMVDVPWEKHRCFFEDWKAQRDAIERVRTTATELGAHPGLFAISVANEIPHDVVRFYGARKVARFVDQLLQTAREASPHCLLTYCNYPSTEFLNPALIDFYCTNIYLHDPIDLGRYLDRLQHIADVRPLVLGEIGIDSMRQGVDAQAHLLAEQVQCLFRKGAAGSFVFSYTDEWHTGGHGITDWAFGVTKRDRSEKPAARALSRAWNDAPDLLPQTAPKVSVVVCVYNGAATLEECLRSLREMDYPNYEVIVVDDGSTDQTSQLAAKFPEFKYIRQDNRGLSAARNAGAHAATAEIVAYTDCDCVADPTWLSYLVRGMIDQRVDAIGGPNVTPASDNWIAQCVSASPGNPTHVMINDREAEHVPGCNMAFNRAALLRLGGFDPQFRVAGDDVDICWRFLDGGLKIGYAPAALVHHHRRATIGAYLNQQAGYGCSEALVQFKHPHRVNALGCIQWNGVIYGNGAHSRSNARARVFHGQFGLGAFQLIYRQPHFDPWQCFTLLQWHALAAFIATLSIAYWPLLGISVLMSCATLSAGIRSAILAHASRWSRPLIFLLHLTQPVVRSWHRYRCRLSLARERKQLPPEPVTNLKKISPTTFDLYWQSNNGIGRKQLLQQMIQDAVGQEWRGDYIAQWQPHDIHLIGDAWHDLSITTASEELGGSKRFTRARCRLHSSGFTKILSAASVLWLAAASINGKLWTIGPALAVAVWLLISLVLSRRRLRQEVAGLLWRAGEAVELLPYIARDGAGLIWTPSHPTESALTIRAGET